MLRQVLEAVRLIAPWVIVGDGEDLVVVALFVGHVENAHRAGPDDATGERRLRDHDQDVERVAVIGQAALDEAVIAGVVDARVEDPVQHEPVSDVVILVLVPAPARDLHHDLDRAALRAAHPESMPG